MPAYYNEVDPHAAQWLRNLIAAGEIAPGDVDERSIVEVKADDVKGYTQCHWFAGIGAWSYALRLAGVPDDRPVWTGSCPCQPFSAAGQGKAGDDERHLWPAWLPIIRECRPAVLFGEQVEAAIGWGWLDLVFRDLEAEGYACAPAVLPACSVGAPHIRDRVWFVANAGCIQEGWTARSSQEAGGRSLSITSGCGTARSVAHHNGRGRTLEPTPRLHEEGEQRHDADRRGESIWSDIEWIPCSDGRCRPTQSGTFPLVDGSAFLVGSGSAFEGKSRAKMLKAYGNAIVAPLAAEFIAAAMECVP